jgi:hypothetical protein
MYELTQKVLENYSNVRYDESLPSSLFGGALIYLMTEARPYVITLHVPIFAKGGYAMDVQPRS